MAVMLYNFLAYQGAELDMTPVVFADDDLINEYAKSAVSALVNKGSISGVGDNLFDPKGDATRAQAVQMLYGALIDEEGNIDVQ